MSAVPERCFEFVAPSAPLQTLHGVLPTEPGSLMRNADAASAQLYYAPRRWLVIAPSEALYQNLVELDLAGHGALVDVEGKWHSLRIEHQRSIRIVENSVNLGAVLAERSCAAVAVFDCPTIIARDGTAYECWVLSSYAESLLRAMRCVTSPS